MHGGVKTHGDVESALQETFVVVRRRWPLVLAVKAMAISVVGLGAGYTVNQLALPRLLEELEGSRKALSPVLSHMLSVRGLLSMSPLAGLLLGLAAIGLKPLRTPLALLAMVAAIGSVAAIVGMLVLAMMPLYQGIDRGL